MAFYCNQRDQYEQQNHEEWSQRQKCRGNTEEGDQRTQGTDQGSHKQARPVRSLGDHQSIARLEGILLEELVRDLSHLAHNTCIDLLGGLSP